MNEKYCPILLASTLSFHGEYVNKIGGGKCIKKDCQMWIVGNMKMGIERQGCGLVYSLTDLNK